MASNQAIAARAPAGARALARAVPAWAWLGALVVASTVARYLLARRIVAPWIMVDELIYSELAKSFAASGEFLVREHSTGGYGPLYPLLISPAYALRHSPEAAYAAIKAIGSLAMSLAAIPAYLLARRVLRQSLALAAALLAVAIPSFVYTGNVVTETLFYPLFLLEALLLLLVLERATLARTLVLYGVWLLAFLTRPQAIALLPAIVTALVLAGGRLTVRLYRWPLGLLAGAFALALAVQLGRGHSLADLLGAYKVTSQEHYTVGAVAKWLVYHVGELDLYVGVAPFAALVLLALRAPRLPRELRLFAVAAVSLSAWLLLEVAAFASLPSVTRIEERYDFYLAPLLFVALLVWIERGLPRDRLTAAVAALSAALVAVLPFNSLIGTKTVSDTLMLLPWWWLHDRLTHDIRLVAILCAFAAAALFLRFPRALPVLLVVYLALCYQPIEARIHQTALGTLFAGITRERNWIDRRVPSGQEVVALHSGAEGSFPIWENEFFNRRIGRVLYLHEPTGGNLPETKVAIDARTGVLHDGRGRAVVAPWVLTDSSVAPAGRVVAKDERRGMLLLRVHGPLRSTTRVTGLYPDTWSGWTAAYTRLQCHGGSVAVTVQQDTTLFANRAQTVLARVGGHAVARAIVKGRDPVTFRVPLRGGCTVRFSVAPTAVPARVLPGSSDSRVLGIHFNGFEYSP